MILCEVGPKHLEACWEARRGGVFLSPVSKGKAFGLGVRRERERTILCPCRRGLGMWIWTEFREREKKSNLVEASSEMYW